MKYLSYLVALVIISACGTSTSEDKELLRTVVTSYLNSEKENNWNAVYSLRRQEFKDTVPYSVFESHMKKEYAEFPLVGYEIENVQTNGASASVHLTTTVEPNHADFEKVLSKSLPSVERIRSKAVLHWRKEAGAWVLVDGNRAFRALETRLTYEP